jgi:GTP diphosphokinase / guanosine-3',5'-bis(diphosphate) 3'-diphosphatase
VTNGKGVLAKVASAFASAEADITHVNMGEEPAQTATELRFTVSVRDRVHLAQVLRSLKRTQSVVKAQRMRPNKAVP